MSPGIPGLGGTANFTVMLPPEQAASADTADGLSGIYLNGLSCTMLHQQQRRLASPDHSKCAADLRALEGRQLAPGSGVGGGVNSSAQGPTGDALAVVWGQLTSIGCVSHLCCGMEVVPDVPSPSPSPAPPPNDTMDVDSGSNSSSSDASSSDVSGASSSDGSSNSTVNAMASASIKAFGGPEHQEDGQLPAEQLPPPSFNNTLSKRSGTNMSSSLLLASMIGVRVLSSLARPTTQQLAAGPTSGAAGALAAALGTKGDAAAAEPLAASAPGGGGGSMGSTGLLATVGITVSIVIGLALLTGGSWIMLRWRRQRSQQRDASIAAPAAALGAVPVTAVGISSDVEMAGALEHRKDQMLALVDRSVLEGRLTSGGVLLALTLGFCME